MAKDKIALLEKVGLFRACSRKELDYIARVTDEVRVEAGRVLAAKGQPGHEFFLIIEGTAVVQIDDGITLGPGDFFGEMALIDEAPRSATAMALETTETWTLHREEFVAYLQDNPDLALHVLKTLAGHIRRLNVQLADIFFLDLPGRLARTLLNLADQYGRHTVDGTIIDVSLTQTDLAEMTGATRVSINKALGRFKRSGWVRVAGKELTVLDRQALEELIAVSGGRV